MATTRLTQKWLAICAKSVIFVFDKSASESALIKLKYSFDVSPLCCPSSAPAKENEEGEEDIPQNITEAEIVDSAFSNNGKMFAVATSTKHLLLYEVSEMDWKLFGNVKSVPKAPTRVRFDADGNVVVGDRSGALRKFKIGDSVESEPVELLGHVSMLLDVCFSAAGKRVLTADRDEKLRISRYPQTFVIEAFCLGHTSFINTVVCVDGSVAASAGGDSEIRFWNVESGKCVFKSGKICAGAIRKLCVCRLSKQKATKLVVLPENSNTLKIFDYDPTNSALSDENSPTELSADDGEEAIFDVAFDDDSDSLVCLGRQSVYWTAFGGPTTRNLQRIQTEQSADVLALLKSCRDSFPVTRLFKAVGFENMKAYTERKEEKKLKRKRKLGAERNNGDADDDYDEGGEGEEGENGGDGGVEGNGVL